MITRVSKQRQIKSAVPLRRPRGSPSARSRSPGPLDWSKAEDERIEAQVAEEMGDNPLANKRRGVKEIWRRIDKDGRKQEALHSANDEVEQCIVVKLQGVSGMLLGPLSSNERNSFIYPV